MSQYHFSNKKGFNFVIGWDRPLGTYFIQVYSSDNPDDLTDWVGVKWAELPDLDSLKKRFSKYGHIPDNILKDLQTDYNREPPTKEPFGDKPKVLKEFLKMINNIR